MIFEFTILIRTHCDLQRSLQITPTARAAGFTVNELKI